MPSFPHSDAEIRHISRMEARAHRLVFVHGLKVMANIGVYDHEHDAAQPLIIDVDIEVAEPDQPSSDNLEDVLCYNKFTQSILGLIAEGHIKLVETLAEKICSLGLAHPMVLSIRVRIEKPDAIDIAEKAGVEIFRVQR